MENSTGAFNTAPRTAPVLGRKQQLLCALPYGPPRGCGWFQGAIVILGGEESEVKAVWWWWQGLTEVAHAVAGLVSEGPRDLRAEPLQASGWPALGFSLPWPLPEGHWHSKGCSR